MASDKFTCNQCREDKDISEFRPDHRIARGHAPRCKDCEKENARKNFRDRRITPEIAQQTRSAHLMRTYGITSEQYDKMVQDQKGCCAICKRPTEVLEVDHDHKTHAVRGLLCNPCNQALGLFQDNPLVLEEAVKYLRQERPMPDLFTLLSMLGAGLRPRRKS